MGDPREVRRKDVEITPRHSPHSVLRSATGFLSFMSGYTVFLGPITGIMVTDVSPRDFLLVFNKNFRS